MVEGALLVGGSRAFDFDHADYAGTHGTPGCLASGDGWLLDETAGRWFQLPFGPGRPFGIAISQF